MAEVGGLFGTLAGIPDDIPVESCPHVATGRDADARQEVDLPGLSGRFRTCAVSLRMVPVLLNLVQKLPVSTGLPVLCPWDLIRSIF